MLIVMAEDEFKWKRRTKSKSKRNGLRQTH